MGLGSAGLANYANTSSRLARGLAADGGIGGASLQVPMPATGDVFDALYRSLMPLGHFFLNLVV